jgi:hypothetical protein
MNRGRVIWYGRGWIHCVLAVEFTAAKGMKGVRRDERDGGREKRAGRREAGKRDAGEGIPSVLFYVH